MDYVKIIKKLNSNNMEGYVVKNKAEVLEKLDELLKDTKTLAVGGSMTLHESGVIDYLRNIDIDFLDRYQAGLSKDEIQDIYRESFFVDTYITSTNSLTENGELYNIDGNGNRVAAMIYGPKNVIVIAGKNKIVKDLDEAKERLRRIAAPKNAKRLNRNTPCAKVGYCVDCKSEDRICSSYVVLAQQQTKGRIKVIIVDEEFGY